MRTRPTLTWSPSGPPLPRTSDLAEVVPLVDAGGVLVLSGAGLSTESGIPDYRGEGGSLRRHTPMTYEDFTTSAAGRQRYWARSHVGWRTIARAHPNAGHLAVTRLAPRLSGVITQNVDGLHQAAGTGEVVELHGGLDRVICLSCKLLSPRVELDRRLREANPDFAATTDEINPDGDVFLPEDQVRDFTVVPCSECGGVLKPDVVFFGENVPRTACRAVLRPRRQRPLPARARIIPHGHVRAAVRAARGGGRKDGRHHQPGRDARRPVRLDPGRSAVG